MRDKPKKEKFRDVNLVVLGDTVFPTSVDVPCVEEHPCVRKVTFHPEASKYVITVKFVDRVPFKDWECSVKTADPAKTLSGKLRQHLKGDYKFQVFSHQISGAAGLKPLGNPKLIVDGGSAVPPPKSKETADADDKNILVKAYNDVSHNPADVFRNKTVTFLPPGTDQSITITFRGANPFGWTSNTKSGVEGKALKITGAVGEYVSRGSSDAARYGIGSS